ncbi:hypothetical protein ATK30_8664 [Amycolatopsis echigonensis]|uniref:Uncharacterized protein n=1 Tax=Amycolatopsis echigonensis TaxID=2576905 RepID=A0A2N3WUY8_9PSEU|nr:hypothetical protein [Amycolatopsis niigatensis]PKV97671.1 hypothetical protein ATK30_8664 [Amycolatopsis niigatensis]
MPPAPLSIRTVLDGRPVSRDDVLKWEAGRMRKAAAKLGLPAPRGDLAQMRTSFADAKLALGPDEVRRRLNRDLRLSETVSRALTGLSRGRRALSTCDLYVSGAGRAGEFVDWFCDTGRSDYARSMIAANPDHFLIDTAPDGRQEVVETTGGSPLATRFFIDYADTSSLVTPRDAEFPLDASGVARTAAGQAIGGVRHEFRDQDGGFHARLRVEFPKLTAPAMLREHRLHLACEFSNWIAMFRARP